MAARETASAVPKTGRYRWAIVALLFVATTVNYIDRTMLGLLAPRNWDDSLASLRPPQPVRVYPSRHIFPC